MLLSGTPYAIVGHGAGYVDRRLETEQDRPFRTRAEAKRDLLGGEIGAAGAEHAHASGIDQERVGRELAVLQIQACDHAVDVGVEDPGR